MLPLVASVIRCSSDDSSPGDADSGGGTDASNGGGAGTGGKTSTGGETADGSVTVKDCTTGSTQIENAVCAAAYLLSTLPASQLSSVALDFSTSAARTEWSNLPGVTRAGVKMGELTDESQAAALALMKVVLTDAGMTDLDGVRAADDYLGSVGSTMGGGMMGPGGAAYASTNYTVAILGTPSTTENWEVMFGGHHMAFNVSYIDGVGYPVPNHLGVEPKASFTINGATYQPMVDEGEAMVAAFTALSADDLSAAYLTGQAFSDVLIGPVEYQKGSTDAVVSTPVCGRPFLVEGRDVRAASIRRSDYAHALTPELHHLTSAERDALAAHWTEVGLMEHASVAAFARFALQLLSLGAPADLLLSTHSALADELEHTRLAFGLASAYGGAPVGPGAIAMERALTEVSFVDLVRTAYLEACVGETCAAVEASEARQAARDLAVRGVLTRIADDELRHAVLGYRFVEWALRTSAPVIRAEIRAMLHRELEGLVGAGSGTLTECVESALTAHGLLPSAEREATRQMALRDVVVPATRALLETSAVVDASDRERHDAQSLSVA
jgi:hypothetical protein